jgi:sodium bicarbonate cotransporter 5
LEGKTEFYPLFCQLNELYLTPKGDLVWRESARWLKFLEQVEDGSGRWSKPHVSTFSLHQMIKVRELISNGTVLFGYESKSFKKTVEDLTNSFMNDYNLTDEIKDKIKETLLLPQIHQCQDEFYQQLSNLKL